MKKEKHKKMMKKRYDLKNKENVRRISRVVENEVDRRKLWRTENQVKNKKYNEYCKKNDTCNTEGGWKNKLYSVGKSQWQRKWENEYDKMNKKYGEKKKQTTIKTREAVILYDKEVDAADAYKADVEKINGDITVKIIFGKRKLPVKVHQEIIDNEELLELALKNRASIYVIDEIIEK